MLRLILRLAILGGGVFFAALLLRTPTDAQPHPAAADMPYHVFLPLVVEPASTATPTRTATRTPTLTLTATNTRKPTHTPTVTLTPSITFTPSPTLIPSNTPTPSLTLTPSITPTPSDTPTPSNTPTASPTNVPCGNIPGETYAATGVNPPPSDRPAAQHADLNLGLRGYIQTTGTLGLVDYTGSTDTKAPKLYSLFGDQRVPQFTSVSQVYDWNWSTNSRANPITYPPVTLAGMGVTADEPLHVPSSGYNIGNRIKRPPLGFFEDTQRVVVDPYEVLVLYATATRITLKYTREDNVIRGYTIHVENVCVAPDLLALYQQWNAAGRSQLPALRAGQAFGRAIGTEIGVAIRDNGTFMDPRSRKDWW